MDEKLQELRAEVADRAKDARLYHRAVRKGCSCLECSEKNRNERYAARSWHRQAVDAWREALGWPAVNR